MTGSDIAAICVAVIYGVAHMYTAYQSREAKHSAEKVASSVGPPNDEETVRSLLEELREFNRYQHQRNHDIANTINGNSLRLYLIGKELGVDIPPPKDEPLPPIIP